MNLQYTPLLHIQRELQGLPRNFERFERYLRTVLNADRSDVKLMPLLAVNPMGKDHVTTLLDQLLALDADGVGASAAAEASAETAGIDGDFRASLVVVDDLMGGWTNRWSYELDLRRPAPSAKRFWLAGYLWSSEPASVSKVRETILTAAYRTAYVQQHGPARTLRELMKQEGGVMLLAGCTTPTLDEEDVSYTRRVIEPHLDADEMRTLIECLFGDAAGRTLGFSPRGLSPWAGIALALHDAKLDGLSQNATALQRRSVS